MSDDLREAGQALVELCESVEACPFCGRAPLCPDASPCAVARLRAALADPAGHALEVLSDETPKPLLVLDIDGTVRQSKDDPLGRFVNGPDDVRVFPEAVRAMAAWRASGGRIIGVSNQGGVALGFVEAEDVAAAMDETQHQCGRLFDAIAWCPHHPQASDPDKARCWCRKPLPGGAIAAMHKLGQVMAMRGEPEWYPPHLARFVGDRPEDQQCAEALGIEFQWAADWRAASG